MSDEPSSLVLFLISAGVITLFLIFLWGVNKIAGWKAPKSEPPDREETHAPASARRRSPVVSRPLHQEPRLIDLLITRLLRTERTNAESHVQERSGHQDACSDVQDRSFVQDVHGEILPNSREELQALIAAIKHKDNGKTKQEAIERAFGVRKGGSEKWRRASELFDAATEPASRYRQYTPEMLAVLQPKPNAQDN